MEGRKRGREEAAPELKPGGGAGFHQVKKRREKVLQGIPGRTEPGKHDTALTSTQFGMNGVKATWWRLLGDKSRFPAYPCPPKWEELNSSPITTKLSLAELPNLESTTIVGGKNGECFLAHVTRRWVSSFATRPAFIALCVKWGTNHAFFTGLSWVWKEVITAHTRT